MPQFISKYYKCLLCEKKKKKLTYNSLVLIKKHITDVHIFDLIEFVSEVNNDDYERNK